MKIFTQMQNHARKVERAEAEARRWKMEQRAKWLRRQCRSKYEPHQGEQERARRAQS